jgi:dihydroorotate dehydrogenase (fumarate)
MTDLTARYLGLTLGSPVIASASPLTGDLEILRQLDAAGAGAAVLPSLFEEQVSNDLYDLRRLVAEAAEGNPEPLEDLMALDEYNAGPPTYLEFLEAAKDAVDMPIIASLNGTSAGGWVRYARALEDAGADALELNVYHVAADPAVTGVEVERRYLELVGAVRAAIHIPLAVKVGPYFSSMANMAVQLVEVGADGLVLFNRFLMPDIDLESLEVTPTLRLSTVEEVRLPLRWLAILRDRVEASLAATSGAHGWPEVVKLILAGADSVMMAAALIRHGPDHVVTVLDGLDEWLDGHGFNSVAEARGTLSQDAVADPAAFERSNYMQAMTRFANRIRD